MMFFLIIEVCLVIVNLLGEPEMYALLPLK